MIPIDSHQHYWQLGRFAYTWLTPGLQPIYRDFLPADLIPQMEASGIAQSVLVQADASLEEINWLLGLADAHPHIQGVVGWVDLLANDLADVLPALAEQPLFKGVRPNLPSPGTGWKSLDRGMRLLAACDLSCDLLVSPDSYPWVGELASRYAGVRFILDHLAGARVTPGGHHVWSKALAALSRLPNIFMKVSGYLSAADPKPLSLETFQPYLQHALELFGPTRLMFGSDWPVCTLGGSYAQAVGFLRAASSSLTPDEIASLWSGTAVRVYRLDQG